eukprot:Selendium_serpulae@DN6504_c0_g3_i6.p3
MTSPASNSSTSKSLSQVELEQPLSSPDNDPFGFATHGGGGPNTALPAFLSNPAASHQLNASLNAAKNLTFTDSSKETHQMVSNRDSNDCTDKPGESANDRLIGQGDDGVEGGEQANLNGLSELRWILGTHKIQPETYFGGRHQYLKEDPLRRQFGTSGSFTVANSNGENQSRGSPAPFC